MEDLSLRAFNSFFKTTVKNVKMRIAPMINWVDQDIISQVLALRRLRETPKSKDESSERPMAPTLS